MIHAYDGDLLRSACGQGRSFGRGGGRLILRRIFLRQRGVMLGTCRSGENFIHCRRGDIEVPSCHSEAQKLRRQVSTLSEFGKRALRSDDIDGLLQEATRLVSEAIDVDLVKVLELLSGGRDLLVRAGV